MREIKLKLRLIWHIIMGHSVAYNLRLEGWVHTKHPNQEGLFANCDINVPTTQYKIPISWNGKTPKEFKVKATQWKDKESK